MENNILIFNIFLIILIFFFVEPISKSLNLYDIPEKRKIHSQPVPLIGGLIIFFVIFLNYLILKNINIYIFGLSAIYFIVGLIDDAKKISAVLRLSILSLATILYLNIIDDFKITFLNFEQEEIGKIYIGKYSLFFSVLCILLFQNAMNMIDGLNGLSGSIFLLITIFILSKTGLNTELLLIVILLIIFLIFNLSNRVFLGDAGIYFLSTYLAINIIMISNNDLIYSEEIFLIMMVPGIDMFRLFVLRILNKKNPFKPDKFHLHHLVQNKFKSNLKTLIFLLLLYGTPVLLAIFTQIKTIMLIISGAILYFLTIYNLKGLNFSIKKNKVKKRNK
ncbi:undecaprenyl/decaprenyl-phosphate alpha-N-acetylglucosaminyl 1-phosphate transferase [Candidatus Pelagibacter sp.]|nr:undecaprenyl/decaprenyl-phosphate alpha-N-acetylglucosaminyl 1-phosphate transferase [Candidatus Pelagibacter sp.]